jgi:G3E family GTPase
MNRRTRRFNDAMRARLERIKLRDGAAGNEEGLKPEEVEKQLCVMQAIFYITGDAHLRRTLSDQPPCVSNVITAEMISLNDADAITDEQRERLKDLIPEIMGTCPLRVSEERVRDSKTLEFKYIEVMVADRLDDVYVRKERARGKLRDEALARWAERWYDKQDEQESYWGGIPEIDSFGVALDYDVTLDEIFEVLRKMAKVRPAPKVAA